MTEIMNYLFSPVGKEWCMYFYFLSIFAFVFFVIAVLSLLGLLMKGRKVDGFTSFFMVFQPFLLYFVNRIFYSMCVNSMV
jgi:hypothetical protein